MQRQQILSRSSSSSARRNVESGKINAQLYCSGVGGRRHKQVQRDGQMNGRMKRCRRRSSSISSISSSGGGESPSLQHFILMRHIKNYVCSRRRMTGEIKHGATTSAARLLVIAQFIGPNTRKSATSILPRSSPSLPQFFLLPPASTVGWRCLQRVDIDIHSRYFYTCMLRLGIFGLYGAI